MTAPFSACALTSKPPAASSLKVALQVLGSAGQMRMTPFQLCSSISFMAVAKVPLPSR